MTQGNETRQAIETGKDYGTWRDNEVKKDNQARRDNEARKNNKTGKDNKACSGIPLLCCCACLIHQSLARVHVCVCAAVSEAHALTRYCPYSAAKWFVMVVNISCNNNRTANNIVQSRTS